MIKYATILFVFIFWRLDASNVQFIDSVKILPSIIYANDTVMFIDFVTLGDSYAPGNDSLRKTGDTIHLMRYYYLSGFPAVESGSDTVNMGTFQPGTYQVLFLASACPDSMHCSDFDTAITYFTILGANKVNNVENNTELTIYPNPATTRLLISTNNFNPQTITIYNLNGQRVLNLPFAHEVDIAALPPGVYFVEVTGVEASEVRKLVKM